MCGKWEISLLNHFMPMKYFHETERNSSAVQTSGKEVTIISVMSSILCVKLDVMTRDVVAG